MFSNSFFPPNWFPDSWFPPDGGGTAPPVPTGKGKGYAGDRRANLIKALMQQELARLELARLAKIDTLSAMLKRSVQARTFREMEEQAIVKQNAFAAYSVLLSEL